MILIAIAGPSLAPAQPANLAPAVTLAEGDGSELVRAHCSACHSLRLVTNQRGDRETWLRLIRWMQETQNLWAFDPGVENKILDYLATNYAPEARTRRAPLAAHLLPPQR